MNKPGNSLLINSKLRGRKIAKDSLVTLLDVHLPDHLYIKGAKPFDLGSLISSGNKDINNNIRAIRGLDVIDVTMPVNNLPSVATLNPVLPVNDHSSITLNPVVSDNNIQKDTINIVLPVVNVSPADFHSIEIISADTGLPNPITGTEMDDNCLFQELAEHEFNQALSTINYADLDLDQWLTRALSPTHD